MYLGQRQQAKNPRQPRPTRWRLMGPLVDQAPVSAAHEKTAVISMPLNHDQPASTSSLWTGEYLCRLAPEHAQRHLARFQAAAQWSYATGNPTADHLLTTVKLNVYRAFVQNMAALGMDLTWMKEDAISPFCTSRPWSVHAIPVHLQPTPTQRQVPHHPWLDFFPHPRMRDRLILASEYDDDELCVDIMAFWNSNDEDPGLIIWGQPWDLRNWELSEEFLRKWGWTVQECPQLLHSTNSWRSLRGEKRLPHSLCQLGARQPPTGPGIAQPD
ncbi:hypothetical protein BJX65DRAFT_282056 [Aspergillus insuetus]